MKASKVIENRSIITFKKVMQMGLAIFMLLYAQLGFAQKCWSVNVRSNINFPTKKLGDATLKTGVGFEGVFAYQFLPNLSAYAGWGWNQFYANESFLGSQVDFEETGYSFGLQFTHPIANTNVNYLIYSGAIYNHIETENKDGKIINDTGHGFGWQIGSGVNIPIGNNFQVVPEIRYRTLIRDINDGTKVTSVDLNYVSASLGMTFSF
jgi:hypothetical protein